MKKVSIKKSKIQGKGLFAEESIKKGETIGVAHQVLNTSNHKLFVPTGIIGKHYNHSKNNPNVENIIDGNKRYLVALKDIKPGTEITSNYFNTPDMEQPKKEWEDKLNEGGEPTDCPEGYYYDPVKGCIPGDEHHKWLREWYANRQMNTPEGQKILKKVQPEILERSTEFPPYVMTEELPKNTPAAYDTEKNVVLLNKFLPEKMLEESKTHENAHYLTSGDKFLNLFDKEIGYVVNQNVIDNPKKINTGNEQWDKNLKENFDYAVSPEEMYSKIMTLRKDAGFDPAKTITVEDLDNYFIKMKDAGTSLNPDIEELKAITKDKQSIVNLLNDLVYQAPTNQDIQITKRGGSIRKFSSGGSIDAAFQKKLQEVAKRLKVKPSDLLGIMKHESGLKASAVNPYTRATGLIQFMPSTAKRMGTSVEALKNMSAIEQLDYVEKFYKPIAGKAKDIGDLYMFTFLPAVVGKPDNYVIGSKGSGKSIYGLSQDALYRQNAVFDKDKKGYYTVGDVKARIAKYSTSKGKLKEDGSKTPGIKMETSPLDKDIPIEEYSEIKYNPVEKVEEPVRPKYTLEQAMFEMGAVETPTNTSQMSAALKFLSPKRFNPQPVQTALTEKEIQQYVKGGYIVEELDDYNNGGEKDKKPVFKLDPNFKLYPEKPLDLPYTPAGGLPSFPKLDLKNIDIKTGKIKQPVIPEWVKQKEEEAISKEILKNGMIEATRISRQGGLDKNKKDFIRGQVREQLGQPTNIKYEQDKKKVVQNKLDALDAAKVNKTPIDLKQFTDSKSDVDFVKTQEQEGWEAMNDLLNEMNNDANVYYDKVKKVSNKDRGDKSNRDLLREDLLHAMENGNINNLLTNIKDKSGEWQYNQLAKKEAATPWINPLSFSGLGLFDKGTKIGQFTRDFAADPLNVMEELIWDQDYMVNRNEILRDPSHPLHAYYMKRTGMDKSPLSQALQYINPFSSAAESSVAIGKGDYGDAAYQLGEGLAKTVGIAAAVEFAPLLGQYTIPGLSNALPGMTYAQGLNVLGAGYGVTQVPKTFKSIKNAFEKGDKESIRAAVNQTATNALDFLGITELKNIWNVPEKSIFYLAEDLTDAKNFAKEIKDLKKSDVVDEFLYQERLDMWKDAMNQTQAKYADKGFQMKPADVLKNPDAVQYLKSTFEQMKAESIAYLESVEGRASVQKMLDEFPRTKRGRDIPGKYINKFGEVFENNRADELKRFINEANKDPKKFVEEFLVNSEEQLMQVQKEINYLERRKAELTQEYYDHINAGDQATANDVAWDINAIEGRFNDRTRDIAKIKEIEGKISLDNPDFESLFNDPHFMYDRHFEPARATEAYRKMTDDPRYHAVDAATEEFTVDDYINQLATQKYYDKRQILDDAKIFEGSEKNRNDLQDLLAQTDPKDPLYQQIKDKIDSLTNQMKDDILGNNFSGNMWFNAFHSGNRYNNSTLIGRGFVPGTETSKPVVIAHEMAHGTPLSWPGFNKKAPWYDIFRSYGSQGSKRMGIHPVDEVLSEIDLFEAPPDFVQYKNMKPWYKGDGVNPYPSTVEEIEIGQGMPLLDYRKAAGQLDVTDAIGIGKNEWNEAKDYFVKGSMGNEKVTFLAEVKQAMLDGGYGKRGNFKMKDLESFWKDYVQKSKKSSSGWDLRLLEIARPTTRTKKYMLKGLNMPGYKKGGSIQLELSDDQIQDYIKQGYVVEESMSKMQDGGKVVSELWTEITGTPWQEAKTRGLTTGTFDENIALRNRLLAGEFGKINNAVSPKTNYDLSVEELVKKGKTLDDLVSMKVGTRSGLMSRFPELFDEETKNKVEAQLDEEENKNYGLQSKINTNPYSDFGKTKNKIKSSKSNKISVNSIKPYEFSSFDLGSSWKNKMYSDFGKPKKENKSDKKDANNFQNNLGIKVDVRSIKEMKKDPIIKNMIDRMEANTKKLKTIESKPLSGSTMPLGPMALDWSKTDFSKGKNNMIVPLGTPMTPVEKLWASIPKSTEEVLETEWGKWGAKRVLELDVLPKIEQQQLRRKLEKEGEVDTPDKIIKLNKEKETKTKLPEVKPKVDTYYQEIATVQDSYDSDNTLLSYRNQWDNNEGFVYYATPVKKDRSENDEYSNVKGVAHFLLDASASKSKPYTHEYNKSLIERAKINNDYVPVFTPEKDEFVRLKYKRANDLKKDDKVITPLRQMKFDEIDFSQTQKPDGFKKGINEVKKKDGQGTYLLFKERDGYSRFSGGSVVFIFNDNFGNTIVRDFAGSLNQIENEGIQIKRRYGLTDDNLVIGYHDVGSFSAKIKADNNNKLKAKQWEGFNNEDWTGGALLIPK